MNKKVKAISEERVSEILENGQINNTMDMGAISVHSVVHDGENKIVVSAAVGCCFKVISEQ